MDNENASDDGALATHTIENIEGPDRRRAVYRFWYEVYIEEMQRPIVAADHDRKLLADALEDHSTILAACEPSGIIGTVRLNLPSAGTLSYYEDLYRIPRFEGYEQRTVIVTRLMVAQQLRKSSLGVKLAQEALLLSLRLGIQDAYIDCNAHLVPYFHKLGFTDHVPGALHPDFGPVQVMRYDLSDPTRLAGLLGRLVAAVPNGVEVPQRKAS